MTTLPMRPTMQGWQGALLRAWWALVALPWHAIKVYPPVLLIAASAAYASAQFAAHMNIFPAPFNWMQAVAFEWVYLGALAIAGARRNSWFYATVAAGALTSMLYMFLHSAERYGLLASWTGPGWLIFFAACHAVPLTLVGVSYMLMLHRHEQGVVLTCAVCGREFGSENALNGHKRTCKP